MTQVIPVSASAQTQFGVGDGTTTSFQLPPQPAADLFGTPSIFKTDTLGNNRLYPTPRTNILNFSQGAFNNAFWSNKSQCTASDNSAVAPDGTYTATTFSVNTGATNTYFGATNDTTTPHQNQTLTASIWLKNGTQTVPITLYIRDSADVSYGAVTFNLAAGTITSIAAGNGTITAFPNGWYRCSVTGAFPSGAANGYHFYVDPNDPTPIAGQNYFVWGAQLEITGAPTSYIPTVATPVTVTDYSISGPLAAVTDASTTDAGIVTLASAPSVGAILLWQGTYLYVPAATVTSLVEDTILSQYANSPTLLQLITNFETYINPAAALNQFYTQIWDVLTATGFGLDIWGRIVGVNRNIQVSGTAVDFGFKEGGGYQPFGQAPFNGGTQSTSVYKLSDTAFRTLILVKALSNISNSTALSYNNLLQNLFAGRGRCYVTDTGKMQILFTFEFNLQPYEVSIITNSGAFPRPAAVRANLFAAVPASTFGFREGQVWQPFGSGVFANSSELINVA